MSWITIIWSAASGAGLLLSLMHLLLWCQNRRRWHHLCFSFMALGVIGMAAGEVIIMRADAPETVGVAGRWIHVVFGVITASMLGFTHFYFGTGRRWLLYLALSLRGCALVANFTTGENLHLSSVSTLDQISFLGEQVSVLGEWKLNSWAALGQTAALVQLIYMLDATVKLWRSATTEHRKRGVLLGGILCLFLVFASVQAAVVTTGAVRMPFIMSLPFYLMLLAMGFELSRDMIRAARLASELSENQQRLMLAVEATSLGIWIRNLETEEVWASPQWRSLFEFGPEVRLTMDVILSRVHPEDREQMRTAIEEAVSGGSSYVTKCRVIVNDGDERWLTSRGQVQWGTDGRPTLIRSISVDVTDRRRIEEELEEQRRELAHLSRATMLGALSGSLAHELNQPLGIILSNAQAAEALLEMDPPDLAEVRSILADIVKANHRAGEVIKRLRAFLKRGELNRQTQKINEIVEDVLQLARSDLIGRGISTLTSLAPDLPPVSCDRVQLQQVLLNLLMNAGDAMLDNVDGTKQIRISTSATSENGVRITVRDVGCGLPEDVEGIFQPFVTTKGHGLGLGLTISRSIIESHGGRLWAEQRDQGAAFHVEIIREEACA